ncbi:SDR family NAD(P)-dependent oxidoreductase [Rhodococcoides kyotonense]|uniref:Short-chain dehydrogenase n=1 Tax=Rhodococcoides kyotonense TaxID=398843 RepID=A0A177Y6S4_9NOCA|nr:glucose 1-dehydrogenase [Rhodococcus kyotonensis]OAK51206.1 short-chain dehydrogenase [Rhodococcus kyotonensis]
MSAHDTAIKTDNANDMFRLEDRVAIVTGASAGLGVFLADAFARAGAHVVVASRRVERLHTTAGTVRCHGRRALVHGADVADPRQCSELVDAAMHEFGRVDVLINNAGVASAVPATREEPDAFRSVVDVNLSGSYAMARACAQVMRQGSSIINIASVLAVTTAGLPQAAYSASKAGLMGLTRDLARQWGVDPGIRVNALAPGFFETEMTESYAPEYIRDVLEPRMVLGRAGKPEELAATAVWLASPAAGFVTGQTILIDGGMSTT